MSSTTRRGEVMSSTLASNSRLSAASPARFSLRQHFGLERLQARGQGRAPLPDLPRANEPEGRILGEPRGVVNIFVTRQPAIDRLAQQIGQRQLDIFAPAGIAQVAVDEFAQAETFVQLAHQN